MMTFSRRASRSAAVGYLLDRFVGDNDGAVAVGVDHVVGRDHHAGDADRAAEIDKMDMRVRRHDRAGEHKEARRHRIEIAHRAVGDDADAAEPLVDIALHLAPERAKTMIGDIDVLDHGDARHRLGRDMRVITEADLLRLVAIARMRFARADDCGAGKGDDRLQSRETVPPTAGG